jgi:hypothetical protein
MPGDIQFVSAQDFDAWVAWLRAPTKPQCFGLLARRQRAGNHEVEAVCAIGGGCLAVGQDPRPNSLFASGLPAGLYMSVGHMNDVERLSFASIADRLEARRHLYVRHA